MRVLTADYRAQYSTDRRSRGPVEFAGWWVVCSVRYKISTDFLLCNPIPKAHLRIMVNKVPLEPSSCVTVRLIEIYTTHFSPKIHVCLPLDEIQ